MSEKYASITENHDFKERAERLRKAADDESAEDMKVALKRHAERIDPKSDDKKDGI